MAGRSTHWLTGLLLLASAGLGGIVVLELTGGVTIAPEVTAAAPAASSPEVRLEAGEFRAPPQRQFNEISARPLFAPSRRPFVAPATPAEAQALAVDDPAVELELVGVVLTDRGRTALVQPVGEARARWVREQETVAGWLVEEIGSGHVALRDGDRTEVVELRADEARAPVKPKRKRRQANRSAAEQPQQAER